ncbi:Bax inhibitor-1/YccA family membrane protein [Tsukamurella paurometabola]|uniref:Bax inhibitor-1/YccA family protein n=1 Tax=Tsukamurella paurometabola TaxID=2061 RepID=A0A3P8JVL0_TSUPA|nr:Bax inhibitor-1/YccA family protein [Tsukamurella paurometabola]MBS4101766.1 Bax inhibitor-1/YccA family protein [Tsukamurella paurometabola]UEA84786.1 Bax inhibitor-1/YccA family protein [Tsukamurella paurometabola]VDR37369.1 Predicted membrane protein [Tsukamurella paurometabola]
MRESSNPIFRGLTKETRQQAPAGYQQGYPQQGYGQQQGYPQGMNLGMGAAGAAQGMQFQQYQQPPQAPYQQGTGSGTMTIDDVVTKTAATLGVLIAFAVAAYALIAGGIVSAMPLMLVGAIGGFILVMIASFGRKQDNPAIVLSYAALEGLFVGSISFVFAAITVSQGGPSAGALIGQAVLASIGVFIGMLVVYKTGAIRVTPRFTRMLFAAMIGVLVLALGNMVIAMVTGGESNPLRGGGTIAIIFSLVCIAIAAFSFLLDFDQADQLIRAGAPSKAAWGVALGLTVTLVWLYVEILRLLSYFYSSD